MSKRKCLAKSLLVVLLFGWVYLNSMSVMSQDGTNCIYSFDEFAYGGPRDYGEVIQLPSEPWVIDEDVNLVEYALKAIDLAYDNEENLQLWLTFQNKDGSRGWLIYDPQVGALYHVEDTIQYDNYLFTVVEIFRDDDQNIWGKLKSSHNLGHIEIGESISPAPLLAKFNAVEQNFEIIPETSIISATQDTSIVLDRNGIFWFFVAGDGIYRFIPSEHSTEIMVELPSLQPLTDITLETSNTIYFQTALNENKLYYLDEKSLYAFKTENLRIESLEIPSGPWPINEKILVTAEGMLWLGSNGYRTSTGAWLLTHTNMTEYNIAPVQFTWASPEPIYQSSDGKIWFTNSWDGGYNFQGTGWYDPVNGEGCMFTNLPASLVEDANKRVWMVVGGHLYTARLGDL